MAGAWETYLDRVLVIDEELGMTWEDRRALTLAYADPNSSAYKLAMLTTVPSDWDWD